MGLEGVMSLSPPLGRTGVLMWLRSREGGLLTCEPGPDEGSWHGSWVGWGRAVTSSGLGGKGHWYRVTRRCAPSCPPLMLQTAWRGAPVPRTELKS